jgi:hypothetical protein
MSGGYSDEGEWEKSTKSRNRCLRVMPPENYLGEKIKNGEKGGGKENARS